MDEDVKAVLLFILLIVMVILGILVLSQLECTSKAKALGYTCEWGIFQDCVLEKPNGSKVLFENLRYNDLD